MARQLNAHPKVEQRVELRFLLKLKDWKTQKEIGDALRRVHGVGAVLQSTVQRWCRWIQDEGDDICDHA